MITSTNIAPTKNAKDLAARVGWAVLICATLYVCYFSHLGAIGFVGPDEPRYAWIARDMAETGDWVTPRLYGKPWFEKPPLYYWGAAICFKLFGVSEAAARLPSAISALLATLALAWLAWRIYGAETARWLLLLLPTTVGMIGFSHAAATDMPFSAMLTIAMVCAAVLLRLHVECGGLPPLSQNKAVPTKLEGPPAPSAVSTQRKPPFANTSWLPAILFGFFLGLAVLAKGPAAIILCGGAVFFWALFTKRWRDALRLFHPAALASFCATALPWYILCARRNPDFFRVFIIEHNFKRYLTPEFQHIQPFWFYIPILLVAFLPWTAVFLWSVCIGAARAYRSRSISQSLSYFLAWTLFTIAFFSASQSKLPGYILPAIPAIGLLVARSCVEMGPVRFKSFRLTLLSGAFILFILFAFAEWSVLHFSRSNERFGIAAGLVVAALGAANLIFAIGFRAHGSGPFDRLAAACCVVPVLVSLLLADRILPAFFRFDPSGRSLARELLLHKVPINKLYADPMNRALHYSLNFYLHEEIQDWDRDHPRDGYVLTQYNANDCRFLVSHDFTCKRLLFDLSYGTGRFLYRVSPQQSAANPSGSGKPQ